MLISLLSYYQYYLFYHLLPVFRNGLFLFNHFVVCISIPSLQATYLAIKAIRQSLSCKELIRFAVFQNVDYFASIGCKIWAFACK